MTIRKRKRAIASPAAALERALRLLKILHWHACLKPAVLEVQNYCRCGSNSAQTGQPEPLKSTAFKRVHLQRRRELAGSRAACKWAQSLLFLQHSCQGVSLSGNGNHRLGPRSGSRSCEVYTIGLFNSMPFCKFRNNKIPTNFQAQKNQNLFLPWWVQLHGWNKILRPSLVFSEAGPLCGLVNILYTCKIFEYL